MVTKGEGVVEKRKNDDITECAKFAQKTLQAAGCSAVQESRGTVKRWRGVARCSWARWVVGVGGLVAEPRLSY